MKANPMQKIVTLMLVKALMEQDNLFVPMPAISEQHLLELKAQAGKIMLELAKEAGEDTSRMEESVAASVEKAQAAKASSNATDCADKGPATFNELDGEELYSLIEQLKADLQEAADPKNTESRAVVKLGFEDGIGIILTLTNRLATYESAQFAKYPTEGNCGNPDCPGCNSEPTAEAPTIH